MADSTSNFKTIYEIISKADFTGLIAGAKTLEDLADKTTANTKTVQDLTDVVSAGVDGIGNYFKTYSEGFDSITGRFEKLQKDGVTVTGTVSTLAGTLGDTLNAAMKQTVVGGELLGKVLSTNIGLSLAGVGAAGWVAYKGLQVVLGAMNKTAEEAVRYHRGLETTRTMLSATGASARAMADGMVAASERASWTRIGSSFSGYIGFFHGLGDVAGTVTSGFVAWAASASEFMDIGLSDYLGELGENMRRYAQRTVEASKAYQALKLSSADIKTNVNDAKALNEQFEKIGASLNTDTQEVRRMFIEMSTGLRDNAKALQVLQVARAAALSSDVFKANAAEFTKILVALNMQMQPPIESLLKFGIAVTDANGIMLSHTRILENTIDRVKQLGGLSQAEAEALRESFSGGIIDVSDIDRQMNMLRSFNLLRISDEKALLAARKAALEPLKTTRPEDYENTLRMQMETQLRSNEQERLFLQYKVNTQLRFLDLVGEEASEQEKRQAQELRNFRAYRDEQLAMRKESAGLQEQYEAMLKEQHDARMARLEREYAARMNLIRAAADAASSAGQNIGGAAPGFMQLAVLDKERAKLLSEINRLGAGADAKRADMLRQAIGLMKQGYDVAKSNRDELNNQIISSMQTINDLSMRARRGAFETMQMVRESAQERLRMIREDQQLEGKSASERARNTMAEAQTLLSARDQMLAQYQRIGAEIGNIAKTNTATLIEQRVITQDLIATMAKGESVGLNASPATRFRLQEVAPGSAGDVLTKLGQQIEGLELSTKFDENLKNFSRQAEQVLREGGGKEGLGKLAQEFQAWTKQGGRNNAEQTALMNEMGQRAQAAAATVYGDKFVGADSRELEKKLEEAAKVLKEESAKFYTEMEKNWNMLLTVNKTDKEELQKVLNDFTTGATESLKKWRSDVEDGSKDAIRNAFMLFTPFLADAGVKLTNWFQNLGVLGEPFANMVNAAGIQFGERLKEALPEMFAAEGGRDKAIIEGIAAAMSAAKIDNKMEWPALEKAISDFVPEQQRNTEALSKLNDTIAKSAEPGGAARPARPSDKVAEVHAALDQFETGRTIKSRDELDAAFDALVARINKLAVSDQSKQNMVDRSMEILVALGDELDHAQDLAVQSNRSGAGWRF